MADFKRSLGVYNLIAALAATFKKFEVTALAAYLAA